MSIRLDNLLAARGRPGRGPPVPPCQPDAAVPMDLGAAALSGRCRGGEVRSASKRRRDRTTAPHCTSLPESRGDRQGTSASPQVANAHSPLTSSLSMCSVPVTFPGFPLLSQCKALVDSGAAGNFMDMSFALRSRIPLQVLTTPLPVRALDSRPLGSGLVTRCTAPLLMVTGDRHSETLSFHVIDSPTFPVVLGFPWLSLHDPVISWSSQSLAGWSRKCQGRCLGVSVGSTSVESPDSAPAVPIPPEYRDLAAFFSKAKATVLPPHRPGDCAMDLVDGAALPKGHVYPLSRTETEAMAAYVKEALEQGYIRPSKSQVSSSFFFVKKKDGGLRPCIDYRALNKITIPFRYPLPLISAEVERMHGARFFTKLDLRSAYNLVRIREGDEWKTAFSTTSGHRVTLGPPSHRSPRVYFL
uniref:ribonuclease H n=1 Tax=Esox lucius TaxID=8010 RepID=A0AAY5KE51_ESOLU